MRYISVLIVLLFATYAYAQRGHYPENNGNPITKHTIMNFETPLRMQSDGSSNNVDIQPGTIALEHMGTDSVDSDQYIDGSIDGEHLDSAITYITTGEIRAMVNVWTTTGTSASPAANGMRGGFQIANNAAGVDYTLPSAVKGMSVCFYDLNGGGPIVLDAFAGDRFILDGVDQTIADAIDSPGDRGDFICILAIDNTNWATLGMSGVWIPGGAD